jgi:hypothetical protein
MPLRDFKPNEDETKSFSAYVSNGARIISVTFPDEKRRERIDDITWKVQLLPFDFIGNRVTVKATITLAPDEEKRAITIGAEKLEFEGMPKEFNLDETVSLKMEGQLGEEENAKDDAGAKRTAKGDVIMTLDASVNDFVALVPGLDDVVNAINDAVLANLQGAIEKNLIADYERWRVSSSSSDDDDDESAKRNSEEEKQQQKRVIRGNGAPVGVVPKRVARF